MNVSIEESIRRLKAEILAPDWRISPQRAEMIEASLFSLKQHFRERKQTHAMLSMASSVLEHIKINGAKPPGTIDFLKEAMAHVVGLYEDLEYDPDREADIFKSLFRHFTSLKEKIKGEGKAAQPSKQSAKNSSEVKQRGESTDISATELSEEDMSFDITPVAEIDAEKLINDLKASLEKAEEVGSTIGELLSHLLSGQLKEKAGFDEQGLQEKKVVDRDKSGESEKRHREDVSVSKKRVSPIKDCPATGLRSVVVGSDQIAIRANVIAAIKKVKASKLQIYLKDLSVPLKDFGRLFRNLSDQFEGHLGRMKPNKLKNVVLPVMVPVGGELSVEPDSEAGVMLVISYGNWHGVLMAREITPEIRNMVKFEKKQNGDIAGKAYLEDETEVTLLDAAVVLRREGFFVVPN